MLRNFGSDQYTEGLPGLSEQYTYFRVKGKANKKKARVEVSLAYLATERFKRNVVRSRMDLVGEWYLLGALFQTHFIKVILDWITAEFAQS